MSSLLFTRMHEITYRSILYLLSWAVYIYNVEEECILYHCTVSTDYLYTLSYVRSSISPHLQKSTLNCKCVSKVKVSKPPGLVCIHVASIRCLHYAVLYVLTCSLVNNAFMLVVILLRQCAYTHVVHAML